MGDNSRIISERAIEKGMPPITFVTVSTPRLRNLQQQIPVVMASPSIDKVIVIVGIKHEKTVKWLKSQEPKGKLSIIYREWDGDFPAQYNTYLPYISEGWVLICDDDEIPSQELLESLRQLVYDSQDSKNFDVVAFRGRQVGHGWGATHNREDSAGDYHREIFYRWNPQLRYEIEVHQSLLGLHGPQLKRDEIFYHIKNEVDLWRNACRSFFVGGRWDDDRGKKILKEGVKGPEWHRLHGLLERNHPGTTMFPQLHRLMISGKVCQEFRDWALEYADNDLPAGGELAAYRPYQEYLDGLPEDANIKVEDILE